MLLLVLLSLLEAARVRTREIGVGWGGGKEPTEEY